MFFNVEKENNTWHETSVVYMIKKFIFESDFTVNFGKFKEKDFVLCNLLWGNCSQNKERLFKDVLEILQILRSCWVAW